MPLLPHRLQALKTEAAQNLAAGQSPEQVIQHLTEAGLDPQEARDFVAWTQKGGTNYKKVGAKGKRTQGLILLGVGTGLGLAWFWGFLALTGGNVSNLLNLNLLDFVLHISGRHGLQINLLPAAIVLGWLGAPFLAAWLLWKGLTTWRGNTKPVRQSAPITSLRDRPKTPK